MAKYSALIRKNQTGSVAQFVIIAVVLALTLIGVVYAVNRYSGEAATTSVSNPDVKNESAKTDTVNEDTQKDAATSSSKDSTTPKNNPSPSAVSNKDQKDSKDTSDKKNQETKSDILPSEAEKKAANSQSAATTPASTASSLPTTGYNGTSVDVAPATLPETGPVSLASMAAAGFILGLYVVIVYAYRRSHIAAQL